MRPSEAAEESGYVMLPLHHPDLVHIHAEVEGVRAVCEDAGIEYAGGALDIGRQARGRPATLVLDGVVVARGDVKKLADAVARSDRPRPQAHADEVVLASARSLGTPFHWGAATDPRTARPHPVRIAAWAARQRGRDAKPAGVVRAWFCGSGYPSTAAVPDLGRLVTAAEEAGWPGDSVRLVDWAVRIASRTIIEQAAEVFAGRDPAFGPTRAEVDRVIRRNNYYTLDELTSG